MKTYECGCVNDHHYDTGAEFSVTKCDKHRSEQRETQELDAVYYEELGVLNRGVYTPDAYISEFLQGFGAIPTPGNGCKRLLELGCGVSPYAPVLMGHGWKYLGIDNSRFAVDWLNDRFGQGTAVCMNLFGLDWFEKSSAGSVLAAHSLEHIKYPARLIQNVFDILVPGGTFYILVPHGDDDPVNPDHLWFWNERSLSNTLERFGFQVERMTVHRFVERERFIYCIARKPNA